jgi:hypothetical protein
VYKLHEQFLDRHRRSFSRGLVVWVHFRTQCNKSQYNDLDSRSDDVTFSNVTG